MFSRSQKLYTRVLKGKSFFEYHGVCIGRIGTDVPIPIYTLYVGTVHM